MNWLKKLFRRTVVPVATGGQKPFLCSEDCQIYLDGAFIATILSIQFDEDRIVYDGGTLVGSHLVTRKAKKTEAAFVVTGDIDELMFVQVGDNLAPQLPIDDKPRNMELRFTIGDTSRTIILEDFVIVGHSYRFDVDQLVTTRRLTFKAKRLIL